MGLPNFDVVYHKQWPFKILPAREAEFLRTEYYSKKNIRNLGIKDMHIYISRNGFPLIEKFLWSNSNKAIAGNRNAFFWTVG